MRKFILLLTIIFLGVKINAQSTKGTDFWFGFMDNSLVTPSYDVYISAETNVNGVISMPNLGFSQNFNVTANTTTKITLPGTAANNNFDAVGNQGIHITTCDSVTVYLVNAGIASADAAVVFPTNSLGSEYTILNINGSPGDWGDQILIVGTANNTTVTITPSVPVGPHPANVPYTINLNAGQTYQIKPTDEIAAYIKQVTVLINKT